MNIIEAIKELKEGRCEGIKLGDFKIMIWASNRNFAAGNFTFGYDKLISEDWVLINPIKQFEEVEVVRWIDKARGLSILTTEPPNSEDWIKLTGTIKKEIKPKVKCREEVEELWNGFKFVESYKTPFSFKGKKVRLFAEWEE